MPASEQNILQRLVSSALRVAGWISVAALGVMALLLIYEVTMRYLFHKPADWVLDVVQLTQVTLAFMAAAPVLKAGGHITMEVMPALLSGRRLHGMESLSNAICSVGCAWMVTLSWRTFERSYRIGESAYGIALPLYPWKFLVPVCFTLLALQFFLMAIDHFINARKPLH